MSAPLDQQYRRALRWYPKVWRTRNEEVMLGILLDAAEEQGDNQLNKQVVSELRARGLEARFGFLAQKYPAAIRERVSAIALGIGAAFSLWASVASVSNAAGQSSWIALYGLHKATTFGPFLSLGIILYATWLAAFITAVIGRPTLTRAILVATLPVAILVRILCAHLAMTAYISTTTIIMLEAFALFAVLGSPTPRARPRIWMSVALVGTLAWLAFVTLTSHQPLPFVPSLGSFERYFFSNPQPYIALVCTIGPAIVLLFVIVRCWTWAAVTAILLTPWLALYAYTSDLHGEFGDCAVWVSIGIIIIGLTAVLSAKSKYQIQITRR